MKIRFTLPVLCLIISFKLAFSQHCTPWDAMVYYYDGEKVTYLNKAYRCISYGTWSWVPSTSPQYWEPISKRFCEACTLSVIKPKYIQSIFVKPSPESPAGDYIRTTADTVPLEYACSTNVRLVARLDSMDLFKRWEYNSTQTTDTAISAFLTQPKIFRTAVYYGYYCITLIMPALGTTIKIDPYPDGTVKTLESNGSDDKEYYLRYLPSGGPWQIQFTLSVDEFYDFNGWNGNPALPSVLTVRLNDTTPQVWLNPDVTKKKCFLQIQMVPSGTVTINALPDGTIKTVDQSDGRSVGYEYEALDTILLKANPDAAFKFLDWGDSAKTTKDTFRIVMKRNLELYPLFEPVSTVFKLPIEATLNNNMRVEGRSLLLQKIECYNSADIKGTLRIKDPLGSSEECVITGGRILLGNTDIRSDSLHSPNILSNELTADVVSVHQPLHLKALKANRLQVVLNAFPDYVFDEKKYPLKSLPDAEKYIQDNGHLEGVPSAGQVKGGVDVGSMYSTLLQKVEEMSLYVIQLHKQISELELEKTYEVKKSAANKTKEEKPENTPGKNLKDGVRCGE